jgi:hypothetical protein
MNLFSSFNLTACPLGVLIAPAGMGRWPAEQPACARTAVVNHNHRCVDAGRIPTEGSTGELE